MAAGNRNDEPGTKKAAAKRRLALTFVALLAVGTGARPIRIASAARTPCESAAARAHG
jgi:hypothetical protein